MHSKAITVEGCLATDAMVLQREGVFAKGPGLLWSFSWKRGEEVVATIGYRLEGESGLPSSLRFSYTVTDPSGEKVNYDYPVQLDFTPCHFGGGRWWFVCSLVVNGAPCHRRVRRLYLPPGGQYFGCRTCYNLTYRSAQEHDKRVDAFLRLPPNEIVKAFESKDRKKFLLALKACEKLPD